MAKEKERIYAQVIRESMRVNLIGGIKEGLYPFDLRMAFTVDITDRPGVKIGMIYNPSLDEFQDDGSGFILPTHEPEPSGDDILEIILDMQYDKQRKIVEESQLARIMRRMIDVGRTAGLAEKAEAFYNGGRITNEEYNDIMKRLSNGEEKKEAEK